MLNKNTCSVTVLSYAPSKQAHAPFPCIVPVFYHERAVRVNDSNYVSMHVMSIAILHAVIRYKRRAALVIIEEMQLFPNS